MRVCVLPFDFVSRLFKDQQKSMNENKAWRVFFNQDDCSQSSEKTHRFFFLSTSVFPGQKIIPTSPLIASVRWFPKPKSSLHCHLDVTLSSGCIFPLILHLESQIKKKTPSKFDNVTSTSLPPSLSNKTVLSRRASSQ